MSNLVTVKNISKKYPYLNTASSRFKSLISLLRHNKIESGTEVLSDINLNITKGESLAIIGKNGAGKSTLLKIISGVINPTSGIIEITGSIGALLELGSGFHPDYSGLENLKMSAALAGLSENQINNKLQEMIDFADIGEYIDQPVKTYSSGMVVRLGFSVVTVTKPDILITDEVLAVGDADFQRKCIAWIDGYLKNGGTLLLVSHSIYHVQKLCKHAIWLENGKIKKQGSAFEVSQEYQSFYEKKKDGHVISGDKDSSNHHVTDLILLNNLSEKITRIESNQDLIIKIKMYSPDGRPPGLALGIIRNDIPVYGTISETHNATPIKISNHAYEYTVKYNSLKLLPADYTIKAHAMDPECLRLIDEVAVELRVHSNTTDMGVVILDTEWT